MSLPSPSLSVPTLSNDQLQFQGLTIGAGTVFGLKKLEGLDLPQVRSGNTDRPRSRGAFVGLNLLKTRQITATLDVGPMTGGWGSYSNLSGALESLTAACQTQGATEQPLWIKLPNRAQVCCMARVLRKSSIWDITADIGNLAQNLAVQWEATDPYLYTSPTTSSALSLPSGGGLSFPLSFPLSFGTGGSPNQANLDNAGDVECWPTLVVTGPCTNPTIANQTTSGSPTIFINMTLNAGDQLVIDCDLQSVTYFPAGESVGAAYPQVLGSGSTFWSLPAATTSTVAFNSSDSGASGTLAVYWASAYDGIV